MLRRFKRLLSRVKSGLKHMYIKLTAKKNGVNLAGHFSNVIGVAEVGRFFALKLKQLNTPFDIFDIRLDSHQILNEEELSKLQPYYKYQSLYYVNIIFVNADAVPHTAQAYPSLFRHHYNIGVFWWEFDDYFNSPKAFVHLNEVIVFSEFIATAVRKTAPSHVRVSKLPFPFIKTWNVTSSPKDVRRRYGILDTDFTFVFNFDFYSILERKNPQALLKAFQKAFPAETDAKLILKTLHSDKVPDKYREFIELTEALHIRDRIVIIDENLARDEMMSLINAADAYVSLHRSEGLGIGMLEAMEMGKPVIGTRFGGNLEFMNDDVSLLVNYKLVPLEKDALPYRKGWLWAEPDIEMAAGFMRQLYENREFGNQLGAKAKSFIASHYSVSSFEQAFEEWAKETPIKSYVGQTRQRNFR